MNSSEYPGYGSWISTLAMRDTGFAFIAIMAVIVLIWLVYSRTIFKRLENISRPVVVVVFFTSIITLQLVIGGKLQ